MVEMTNDKSFVDDNNDAISWEGRSQTRRHRTDMQWNEMKYIQSEWKNQGYANQPRRQAEEEEKNNRNIRGSYSFCSPATMHNTLYKDCARLKLKR